MSAPSPDAPGLREALERIAKGHDWQPGQPTHGWASCQRIADAALAASGVAPSPTEAIERLARLLVDESAYGNLEAAKAAIARAGVAPSPDAPGPIESFGHPYRSPVVIDGHLYLHTSDCEWPALAASGDARSPDAPGLLAALEDEGVVTWADDEHRARFIASLAAEWESDETIVNQMEATEYASESHPTKERTDG